jgi:hypothetical protein
MREDSAFTKFRAERLAWFRSLFDPDKETRILDIGGTFSYWRHCREIYGSPKIQITIVNLCAQTRRDRNLSMIAGDACDLSQFSDYSFDVVHSNSVLEHVGDWSKMQAMALEARRLAPKLFVQTPNRGFPFEPHYKLPIVHWLPQRHRRKVLQFLGRVPRDMDRATEAVRSINLINASKMAELFPDCEIRKERVIGFAKSLVAVRREAPVSIPPQIECRQTAECVGNGRRASLEQVRLA